jgi:hypothetical protein
MTNTRAWGAKKQPPSANFKGANGNRWTVGKDPAGMMWDDSLATFLRSRRLGIDGASRAVKPCTIKEYEWDLGVFFEFLRSRALTPKPGLTPDWYSKWGTS